MSFIETDKRHPIMWKKSCTVKWKKHSGDANTACCSKVVPNFFAPLQTPSRRSRTTKI